MSRNDPADMAARLYARVPGNYRVYDAEQGYPLLALLTVIGREVSALRVDLDDLWDDFFIETCADPIVPYLGALVGTKLLDQPIGQSNRLEVWNTVAWRRSKGTPQMLGELAGAISGWPAQVDEFFARLAWSQHMLHLRPERSLTVGLRDDAALARLGGADDPFAHAADLRTAAPLDAARVTPAARGVPVAAFGTHGRYGLDRLGVFVDRLAVYPIHGATPAPEIVPASPPAPPRCFTFDPLFRDRPLFAASTGAPISRRALGAAPWDFAADVQVRWWGVPLVAGAAPAPLALTDPQAAPFDFGGRAAPFGLDPAQGLRVADGGGFAGAPPFVVRATWVDPAGSAELAALGTLRTASAAFDGGTFTAGAPAPRAGRLRIDVLPAAGLGSARFPGAVLAVRAARGAAVGALREADAVYVALPATAIAPGTVQTWWIDAAGAAYTDPSLHPDALARAGIGPVYPPRELSASVIPATAFLDLHGSLGARLVDPARLGGITARFDALVVGGAVVVRAQGAGDLPPSELILTNRAGAALLVYLPAVGAGDAAGGKSFQVADDGTTYDAPAEPGAPPTTFGARTPARRSAGQVLPLAGFWPLRQRVAVAIDHRRREPHLGELGIDPENGRFRLAYGDPLVGAGAGLSVDYGEALRDALGALGAGPAGAGPPTRVVAASGDAAVAAGVPVHRTLHEAMTALATAAQAHEIVEIADSATYAEPALEPASPALRSLAIRAAAGTRPALVCTDPARVGLHVRTPLDRLALSGLLVRGGSVVLDAPVGEVDLADLSLDPESGVPALIAHDDVPASNGRVVVVRSIVGPLALGAGVTELTVADAVLGPPGGPSIGGLVPALRAIPPLASPPASPPARPVSSPLGSPPAEPDRAQTVRLERATVFGTVRATVLHATDVVFADLVDCADRTTGCVRYTRYADGSSLPLRFRTTSALVAFAARRFGRVDYALLDAATDPAVRAASSSGAEPGAFARARDATRVANLTTKLREFAPVRMVPVAIART